MINKVKLPSKPDLQQLIDEALANKNASEFVESYSKALSQVLSSYPLRYRSFGAYWWSVKRILIDQGYASVTGFQESEDITADHWYIDDDATTLIAAHQYQTAMMDSGIHGEKMHYYSVEEDTDHVEFEYLIEDLDMEAQAINRNEFRY